MLLFPSYYPEINQKLQIFVKTDKSDKNYSNQVNCLEFESLLASVDVRFFKVRPLPPTNSTNPLLVPHHRFSAPIVRHSIDSRSAKKTERSFISPS